MTFHYASAHSKNWEDLTEDCLAQLPPLPSDINLGFLYCTDYLAGHLPNIIHLLKRKTAIDHWIGTVGVGICAGSQEIYGTPAMVMLLTQVACENHIIFSTSEQSLASISQANQEWLSTNQQHFGVIHGDPRSSDTTVAINQITSFIPNSYFVGGLTSSQSNFPQIAGGVVHQGVSGIIFNQQVPVLTSLTQGCTLIGSKRTITKCDRNTIFEIDGEPALRIFKQDIGEILARNLQNVAGYIFVALPTSYSDTGDYKVRNLMGIDINQNSLIIGELVEEGRHIQFCRRDSQSAWQDHQDTLLQLKKRIKSPIKGALYFSCLGRGKNLFGDTSKELEMIQAQLGEIPLAGFFANGEIARNELYGYTGVLTLFL